jgi:hypothetical protein
MPFVPELHYFYLFLQEHLKEEHNIDCERADNRILTIPLLEKIKEQILNAGVIIADITGRNANVFYELGLAHAYGKKVILITSDPIKEVPSDIRHYDFIHYDLQNHVEFFSKLNNALYHIFIEDYKDAYNKAITFLKAFNKETKMNCKPVSDQIFRIRFIKAERTQDIPHKTDTKRLRASLLPLIIENSTQVDVMECIITWLKEQRV